MIGEFRILVYLRRDNRLRVRTTTPSGQHFEVYPGDVVLAMLHRVLLLLTDHKADKEIRDVLHPE